MESTSEIPVNGPQFDITTKSECEVELASDNAETVTRTQSEQIRTILRQLVNGGNVGSFAIFENPETKKFIQFVLLDNELMCDIPLNVITQEEENGLKTLLSKKQCMSEVNDGSYQVWFNAENIAGVTELIEEIFIDVFNHPPSYTLTAETATF